MEALNIRGGVAHFNVISRILEVTPKKIIGEADIEQTPVYLGLEAMAQLAALHVRQRIQFERHAFLLNVHHCQMPAMDVLEGCFKITVQLRSQSSNAFRYDASALGPHGAEFNAGLLIGTRDYDDHFPEEILKVHYQKLWAELKA